MLGEHCAASVLVALGNRATWKQNLFDADARSLDQRLELSVVSLHMLSPLELIITVDDLF